MLTCPLHAVYRLVMELNQFMIEKGINNVKMAELLTKELRSPKPIAPNSISRHRNKRVRVPKPEVILAYYRITGGLVTPNDFFDLTLRKKRKRLRPSS